MKETEVHRYNKNKQIEKYHKHKVLFDIKNNKCLDLFEGLLRRSEDFDLECSVKLNRDRVFPCRYNIWYKGKNHVKNINLAFNFLKDLSAQEININCDLLKQIFNKNTDLDKIEQVIVGIDSRENYEGSRAKFWLVIDKQYDELFNKVLDLHGHNQKVTELINKKRLLFGFDFCFNGKTKIKIYPFFDKYELNSKVLMNKLQNIFSPAIFRLISECHMLHISFENKEFNRILHFHPNNLDIFLDLIKNKELNKWVDSTKELKWNYVVSLKEKEINRNKIKELNFYY